MKQEEIFSTGRSGTERFLSKRYETTVVIPFSDNCCERTIIVAPKVLWPCGLFLR